MNEAESVLNSLLKPHGFKKKAKTWVWRGEETLCEIKLEKDRWRANQSYLGVAISALPIIAAHPSDEPVWHLFGRGYSPKVDDKVELEDCLDANCETVRGRPRLELLTEICSNRFVPFVLSLRTIAGIKRAYDLGHLRRFMVRNELRALLEGVTH
jgi:hypothetical protein